MTDPYRPSDAPKADKPKQPESTYRSLGLAVAAIAIGLAVLSITLWAAFLTGTGQPDVEVQLAVTRAPFPSVISVRLLEDTPTPLPPGYPTATPDPLAFPTPMSMALCGPWVRPGVVCRWPQPPGPSPTAIPACGTPSPNAVCVWKP